VSLCCFVLLCVVNAECHYVEYQFAVLLCWVSFMLDTIMVNVVMVNVFLLVVIMLIVVTMGVVAPHFMLLLCSCIRHFVLHFKLIIIQIHAKQAKKL
jgi:hypothetical protein